MKIIRRQQLFSICKLTDCWAVRMNGLNAIPKLEGAIEGRALSGEPLCSCIYSKLITSWPLFVCTKFRTSSNEMPARPHERNWGNCGHSDNAWVLVFGHVVSGLALVLAINELSLCARNRSGRPFFTVGGFPCLKSSVKSIYKAPYSFAMSEEAGMIQESLDMEAQPIAPGTSWNSNWSKAR